MNERLEARRENGYYEPDWDSIPEEGKDWQKVDELPSKENLLY